MNRSFWLILLLFFSATAVGAGWFAVNAPEAARPNFAALGSVRLADEKPPLPPAALSQSRGKGFENVLRRPLFRAVAQGAGARKAVGAAVRLGAKNVGYRSVLPPFAAAPARDFIAFATPRAPRDDFQAAFGVTRPEHKQYFGPHLIPGESLSTDGAPLAISSSVSPAPAPAPEFTTPDSVPIPRPKPKPGSVDAAPTQAVASAATRRDPVIAKPEAAAKALGPEDEIVLLGVLLRRGKTDRALVRLSSGESRRVTLGDTISGWRVSEIKVDSIKLKRASVTREIKVPE